MPDLTLFAERTGDPAVDTALSAVLLERVAAGSLGPSARLHRTPPILAFGRADVAAPGYREAVAAAREGGFTPVERLAGGRAAVFHEGTWAVSMALPADDPRTGIGDRFRLIAGLTAEALAGLGVDAGVGEVPGEYCPGAFSVHARGRVKLAGYGQRLVRGAAHVGGVVVAEGGDRIRAVLTPVYEALGLDWDPATAGDVAGEVGASSDEVGAALVAAIGRRFDVVAGTVPADLVAEAHDRADAHRPGG